MKRLFLLSLLLAITAKAQMFTVGGPITSISGSSSASQSEVSDGLVDNKYVSPATLAVYESSLFVIQPAFTLATSASWIGGSSATIDGVNNNYNGFGGSISNATYRMRHYCTATCRAFRLVYGTTSGQARGTNSIVIMSTVETSDGTIIPVYFNGSRTATCASNSFAISDWVATPITKGDFIYSRTWVSVGNTNQLFATWQHTAGFGFAVNTNVIHSTGTSAYTTASDRWAFIPFVIQGQVSSTNIAIAGFGDSIFIGGGSVGDPYNLSVFTAALGPQHGRDWSHANTSEGGFGILTDTVAMQSYKWRIVEGCNVAICNLGVNDLRGGASFSFMTNAYTTLWNRISSYGMKVWQTTITPETTSTNGWVDTIGQTVSSYLAIRNQVNDWIRTVPTPLSGYFDVAVAAETATNSGIWKASYTQDGLHPTTSNVLYNLGTAIDPTVLRK